MLVKQVKIHSGMKIFIFHLCKDFLTFNLFLRGDAVGGLSTAFLFAVVLLCESLGCSLFFLPSRVGEKTGRTPGSPSRRGVADSGDVDECATKRTGRCPGGRV